MIGSEKIAVLRHVPARPGAHVALGINEEPAFLGLERNAEVLRHKHVEAVEGPGPPAAVLEANMLVRPISGVTSMPIASLRSSSISPSI